MNLTLNESCKRKIIKKVSEVFPDISISIFSQALIIKSIPEKVTRLKKTRIYKEQMILCIYFPIEGETIKTYT